MTKVSDLTAATTLAETDVVPVVASGANKKATVEVVAASTAANAQTVLSNRVFS